MSKRKEIKLTSRAEHLPDAFIGPSQPVVPASALPGRMERSLSEYTVYKAKAAAGQPSFG